jgi:hypothetical protein
MRRPVTPSRVDVTLAAVTAACALGLFLPTMYPGLGGGGDSAKFQYLGRVLGTAHQPGYPLYVMVGWVFSHLPVGTLAFRANLMSACFGALAAGLLFLVLRRLECHRAVAFATALAMAFGRYAWGRSVVAEVYSLAAAFAVAIVLALLRWRDTGRDRDLFAAAAIFSVSLGNHLTLATLGPVLVVYAILVNRKAALRLRTFVVCGAVFLVGLAQYLFVMIRTLQGAAYIEAHATNVRELLDVMRASRYSYQMFTFSPGALWHVRVPEIAGFFHEEFGIAGLAMLLAGSIVAVYRRPREALLLLAGTFGVVFLTLNVDADIDGFLVPAFALAWPLAGLGLEAFRAALARRGHLAAGIAIAAVLALPLAQARANYRPNDHHRRTFEIRYFGALFASIGDRSAIVSESYAVDQLVLYKLLGEKAAGERKVAYISADVAAVNDYCRRGWSIYTFAQTRASLAAIGFRFVPVQLVESHVTRDGPAARRALTAIDMRPLPLFRVTACSDQVELGNVGWRDVTSVASAGRVVGVIDNYRPYDAAMLFYLAADAPLTPRLVVAQGTGDPRFDVRTLVSPAAAAGGNAQNVMLTDGVGASQLPRGAAYVYRAQVSVNDQGGSSSFALDFGGIPVAALAWARVDRDNPKRATVHAIPSGVWDLFSSAGTQEETVTIGDERQEAIMGRGWHGPERDDARTFRWMSKREAELAVPFARTGDFTVGVTARPLTAPPSATPRLGISVNGTALEMKPMQADWGRYEWTVPAAAWRQGLNAVVLRVSDLGTPSSSGASADVRQLGAAVSEVAFRRR